METRITIFVGAAVLLAGSIALAQPPRLIPPVDQYGPAQSGANPLQIPSEPAPAWILRPQEPAYQLQLGGVLEQAGPDTMRVDRGVDAPDAVLNVTSNTSWFLDGRAVTQPQVPPGSRVVVLFDLAGDQRTANQVQASSPGNPVPPAETLVPTPPPVASEIPGDRVTDRTPQELLPAPAPRLRVEAEMPQQLIPAPPDEANVQPLPSYPEVPRDRD